MTLSNQQHRSYLQYVLIPSEPEHFCLDRPIPETLPLLEAPPVVRLAPLQKLLCGVTFYPSHTLKRFTSQSALRAANSKNSHRAV